jgi:cysteine synthase A
MLYNNITEAFGKTPMVRVNRLFSSYDSEVFAKLEFYNPSASVKDRLAIAMVDAAVEKGDLKEGGLIVEATSGNTGIALAMVGAARGFKVALTMPESMSKERRALLRGYGAELILTPKEVGMKGCVTKAEEIAAERGGVLMKQFENEANARIHYQTTGPEIWEDLSGRIDVLVAGVGTGGTISGTGKFLRERNPGIRIFAVEPLASAILNGANPAGHPLQGIGPNFIPSVLDRGIYDEVIDVPNDEAFSFAKRAAREEGLLVGISSGAALWATGEILKRKELSGARVGVVLASYGERYLSTALFEGLTD